MIIQDPVTLLCLFPCLTPFILSLQLPLCLWLLFHISPTNYIALDFTHHHYLGFPSGPVYPVLLSQLQPQSPHLFFLQLIQATLDLHSISLCNNKYFGSFIPVSSSEFALEFPGVTPLNK